MVMRGVGVTINDVLITINQTHSGQFQSFRGQALLINCKSLRTLIQRRKNTISQSRPTISLLGGRVWPFSKDLVCTHSLYI